MYHSDNEPRSCTNINNNNSEASTLREAHYATPCFTTGKRSTGNKRGILLPRIVVPLIWLPLRKLISRNRQRRYDARKQTFLKDINLQLKKTTLNNTSTTKKNKIYSIFATLSCYGFSNQSIRACEVTPYEVNFVLTK